MRSITNLGSGVISLHQCSTNTFCVGQRQPDPKPRFCQMHMIEIQQGKETEKSGKKWEVMGNEFLPAYPGSIWWRPVLKGCRSQKHQSIGLENG